LFHRCQGLAVCTLPIVMRNDLDVRCVWSLRRRIRRIGYDIVHFHTKRAHSLSLWMPRTGRSPKYVVTRRMDYPEPRSWYTDRLYNRRVDGVIAISQGIVDVLLRAGVERQKIQCIASGIDAEKFAGIRWRAATGTDRHLVVGCLAVLEKRKGHQFLLEAAARLKAQGLKLQYRIAGNGPLRRHLENEVKRLGLGAEVSFLGFVEDTAGFFGEVDLLAMPSLHEGLGVAALEAMAAGKPVIASRVGGLQEAVLDGITGILIPPRDPNALASAIAKLAAAPASAESMGRQGRARVGETFSLQRMALRNERYYRELLQATT
jgi:glycosyltransferase involved in cell wall biosynthesis